MQFRVLWLSRLFNQPLRSPAGDLEPSSRNPDVEARTRTPKANRIQPDHVNFGRALVLGPVALRPAPPCSVSAAVAPAIHLTATSSCPSNFIYECPEGADER